MENSYSMKKNRFPFQGKNNKTKVALYALGLAVLAIFIQGWRSAGPAFMGVGGVTGAPGEGTCGNCHAGGSYSPVTVIEVFENGTLTPATSYTPGSTYDLRVTVSSLAGTPGAYGFQLVPLKVGNTMAGSYNTLGSGVRQSVFGSRTYLEHNAPKLTGVFTSKWTAPVVGSGTVTFYANGNCVNNTGNTGGDNSSSATLILPEFSIVTSTKTINFNLEQKDEAVHLSWSTTQEQNNHFFTVEHSQDGEHFNEVGQVNSLAPMGNSNEVMHYHFTHAKPSVGHHFYRLSQTDIDGKREITSSVLHFVSEVNNQELIVYPNPINDVISIDLNELEHSTLILTDLLGRVIKKMDMPGSNQTQHYSFSTTHLPSGSYALLLQKNHQTIQSKIITKK